MAAFPGGTAAPAPKGPPGVPKAKAGPVPRFLNKASGRMETKQAMSAYRPGVRQQAAQRLATPKGNTTVGAGGHGAVEAPAKSWLDMNPGELHNYATRSVQQNTQSELDPYRQKAGEIYGTEQAVAGRYAGYGQQTDQQLAGLQSSAAEGAKTYNNSIADTVLKAQQSVDTTGQNAQAQNAGYMDPQLRAALTAEKGNVTETGLAQQGAAAAQGQGEQNFMANLRAAATQRVAEGQRGIASTYGKQQQANTQEQNRLLGRVPGAITKLETELGQKQFTNRATEAGLGLKQGDLRVKEGDLGVKRADLGVKVQSIGAANARNRENVAAKETASVRSARLNEIGKQTAQMSAEDKARYDAARIKIDQQTKSGKAASPAEGRKYIDEIGKVLSNVQNALGTRAKGSVGWTHSNQEAIRASLRKSNVNADLISAALNLAVYGRLGAADQAAALSRGLTPELRPQWFRKR